MRWWLAALVLLGLALLLRSSPLALATYVLLLSLGISRLMATTSTGRLSGKRNWTNHTCEIGETIETKVSLTNTGPTLVPWVLVEELFPEGWSNPAGPAFRIKGKRLRLAMIGPLGSVKLQYSIETKRRGFYQIGPLVVETGDLFGFFRRFQVEAPPGFLIVLPKAIPLLGFDVASRRPVGEIKLAHKLFEDPTRIMGVREYRAGDSFGRIHWAASARGMGLMTKLVEPSVLAGATIVLEFHHKRFPEQSEPILSDLAVTCAASMALAVCQIRQQVGFLTNAVHGAQRVKHLGFELQANSLDQIVREQGQGPVEGIDFVRIPTRRGDEQFERIRESLACLELTHGKLLELFLAENSWMVPADSTLTVITPVVTQGLAQILGDFKKRGRAVSVILVVVDDAQRERSITNLVGVRIMDFKIIAKEADIPQMCLNEVDRSAPYFLKGW